MKRTNRRPAALLAAFTTAAILAACSGSSPTPAATTPTSTAPPTPAATVQLSGFSIRPFGLGFATDAYFAVDSDRNMYLPGGTEGAALVKVAPDGKVLAKWAGMETVAGQPDTIVGITVDPKSGDVWATDTSADRVVHLASDLSVIGTWGATGAGPGQFFSPGGVTLTPDGNVVVADMGNNRIETFTPDGNLLAVWDAPDGDTVPVDVAGAPDGSIYASTVQPELLVQRAGEVIHLSPDGKVTKAIDGLGGSDLWFPDVAVAGSGQLYVADAWMGVLPVDASMAKVDSWKVPGSGTAAFSVRAAPSGDVYTLACGYAASDCTITEFTPAGDKVATWHASEPVSHPGTMVDVGDHNLYLQCVGSGSPTIVWQAGAQQSGWFETAQYLMGRLAPLTRVCVYDRQGQGASDPKPDDDFFHWVASVEDLHALLKEADVPGPYVMAGNSLGGLLSRIYAYTYPSQVVGLLAIDPSHEDQFAQPVPQPAADITICTDDSCPVFKDIKAVHKMTKGHVPGSLGDLPLVVLAHSPDQGVFGGEYDKYWSAMGEETASASSNSEHVIASWSSHSIPYSQPALVIEAITQLVTAARAADHTLPECGTAFTDLGGICK